MGADNRPFFQNAHARNVSDHGAKLCGIEKQLRPGDVIGIQFGDKKARCKVVWVVDAGTGVLYALNAATGAQVYVSFGQDILGSTHRFITPAVANGRVYVTTDTAVVSYGLR